MGTEHEMLVTWDRQYSGYPTRLHIMQRAPGKLSTASLSWDHEPKTIMHECPIEVMRKIVAMFDALPPVALDKRTK